MGINRKAKEMMVSEVYNLIAGKKNIIVVDPSKISATKMNSIRKEFNTAASKLKMLPNYTSRFVFERLGYPDFKFVGMNAIVVSDDPVLLSKTLAGIQKKEAGSLKVKYAILDGKVATKEDVETLSNLPTRNELLGALVCAMNAPLQSFVALSSELAARFARLLNALKTKKEMDLKRS